MTQVVPVERMVGETAEATAQLKQLWQDAERFLRTFVWCAGIQEAALAAGVPGVVGVFLVRIEPASPGPDEWLWVVVGDLPPAYLSPQYCHDASEAIRGYLAEMRRWVEAVRTGRSTSELIPVNAPPTMSNADALDTRLRLLELDVLPAIESGSLEPRSKGA